MTAALATAIGSSVNVAEAVERRELIGWWLAIDDTLPKLWESGWAIEEVLIVAADGTMESRTMGFVTPDAEHCSRTGLCSDAPLMARARLAIAGDELTIVDRSETTHPIVSATHDAVIRSAALTAMPSWKLSLTAGGRVLTLRSQSATRVFIRIEPDRLRRLRAGWLVAEPSAAKGWRCYLANSTGADPAFEAIRRGRGAPPSFLDDFLKASSYLLALRVMAARPTADDPDLQKRRGVGAAIDLLLLEHFSDIRPPTRFAEARNLRARAAWLEKRAQNVSPAEADIIATALNAGTPVTVAVTGAQIGALARALSADADAKRLFCRE